MAYTRFRNSLPELPPEEHTPSPKATTPRELTPEPVPDPESSVEDIDFGVQDNLFGQIENAFHTTKLEDAKRDAPEIVGAITEKLNEAVKK
jgi:hypothetical protein